MTTTLEQLKSQRTDRKALEHALHDAGAVFKGSAIKCPFHEDIRPSGSIYQGADGAWRFKCHSCGWNGDLIDVQVKGNNQIYGNNHYHHSRFGLGDALLVGWLFSPHSHYYSPYRYGYYPGYYGRGYGYRSTSVYRTSARGSYGNSSSFRSSKASKLSKTAKSPNSAKSAKSIKAPLKNPSKSQKSFQKSNPSKRAKSGGFGRSSGKSSSGGFGKSSVRSGSSQRSGGSYGGK